MPCRCFLPQPCIFTCLSLPQQEALWRLDEVLEAAMAGVRLGDGTTWVKSRGYTWVLGSYMAAKLYPQGAGMIFTCCCSWRWFNLAAGWLPSVCLSCLFGGWRHPVDGWMCGAASRAARAARLADSFPGLQTLHRLPTTQPSACTCIPLPAMCRPGRPCVLPDAAAL